MELVRVDLASNEVVVAEQSDLGLLSKTATIVLEFDTSATNSVLQLFVKVDYSSKGPWFAGADH